MKKGRSNLFFQIGLIFTIFGFSFSTFFCVAAYIKYTEDKSGAFGTIGLRSYFHCGTGTQEDPYVITRPKHLFNLSRLQSLGVFSEPKHFQLGYNLDNSGTYKVYKNDDSADTSLILDMKSYTGSDSTHTLSSIGNESTPFYGIFEGNGLEIANATVECSLEDSGLFGYVSSRAVIRNLLLDNITIKNDGYEPTEYGKLYSDQAGKNLRNASKFNIIHGKEEERTVTYSYNSDGILQVEDTKGQVHDNTNTLSFDISTETNDDSQNITFSYEMENSLSSLFTYSLLSSEDFFERDEKGFFTLKTSSTDKSDVFSFFDSYKDNKDAIYPLELSLTLSLVANYLDSSGINHAKVVSALNISFKKWLSDSKTIVMRVQPRETEHGNNMGLIVGHLDGSLTNVYVHDGAFRMNSESTNTAVDQKSMIGFVGLVGPTVANGQSDAANGNIASSGKDVGVLNFTGIYDMVIKADETFPTVTENNQTYYTYTPTSDNDYMDYLRNKSVNNQKKYYSSNKNTISLIAKKVIKDDETHNRGLGVFSIATDYRQGGEGDDVFLNIESSTIAKSKSSEESYDKYDSQNIFFSTYEYSKETNKEYNIENIENTLNNYTNDTHNSSMAFLPGNHIPLETTVENQSTYEKYYNFLFRFQLDPNKSDFYFSDLDSNTVGGSFLNNYFSYKLIDANGESLEPDSPQFGIMIKDKDRINISELTTNYRLDNSGKMFTIGDDDSNYSVSNSINFEIKTNEANVTILASNNETSGDSLTNGSMLGIYKLPDVRMKPYEESTLVPSVNGNELTWDNPDYGMVLPSTASLAFYEYSNGKIGSSKLSDSYFTASEEVTKNNNQAARVNKVTNNSIELDDAYKNYIRNPIFAHTFKLPKGRYCLGSAIGNADVYYICAQGQENGDLSLSANVFSQINKIDNVDFLKTGLASDATANPYFSIASDKIEQTASLTEQRCYLIFDSGNVSHFLASSKNASDKHKLELSMKYINDTFVFSIINDSDLGSIETLALTNYGYLYTDNKTSIKVQLFGQTANTGKNPRYPA